MKEDKGRIPILDDIVEWGIKPIHHGLAFGIIAILMFIFIGSVGYAMFKDGYVHVPHSSPNYVDRYNYPDKNDYAYKKKIRQENEVSFWARRKESSEWIQIKNSYHYKAINANDISTMSSSYIHQQ